MDIVSSIHCTEEKRNFPPSRYRSKRLRKKLEKRLGPEVVSVPAAYRMNLNSRDVLIAHPAIVASLLDAAPLHGKG